MPYKKVYYTFHCPKCNQDYQVLPQAYFRKIKDPKYGSLCKSCRTKVQLEEMSEEEKNTKRQKAAEANRKRYESLSEEQKQIEIKKRTEGTKKRWSNMSDEEYRKECEERSKRQIEALSKISEECRKEIGRKISKTKIENSAKMTKEELIERKKKKQEERAKYWATRTQQQKDEIIKLLRDNNEKFIVNMSDEEREKRSKFMTERNHEFWNNKSKEERIELIQKMIEGNKKWRNNLTDEEKELINKHKSDSMIKYWDNLTDEERSNILEVRSNSRNQWLKKLTEEEYNAYVEFSSNIMKEYWDTLSIEDREKRNKENRNRWNNLSDDIKDTIRTQNSERWKNYSQEEREAITNKRLESFKRYIDNLSDEERALISKRSKDVWNSKTKEEKEAHIQKINNWRNNLTEEEWSKEVDKQHQWLKELTPEQRLALNNKLKDTWANMSIEKRKDIMNRVLSYKPKNSLQHKFENSFNESHLINEYYFKPEVVLSNETIHSWDYGIYSKDTNELVMVVDLDGAYFHADNSDYDGIHSKEEYDEKRILSLSNNIKHFIIQEFNFSKCFELMVKTLIMNYDNYIDYTFKTLRSMPFPYPEYSDNDLIKSWNRLKNMNVDDKYHQDISLNTRLGDRLINHFHHSIYSANRKGNISPYEAWYDDELLKKVIENRIIYQTYLNPNKILQGFNISKVATKVSVFSAGRAKMLIYKYLNEFDQIFDPFSGFSGRMLGTISLGKIYIGQDISQIHVNESNNMIKFLKGIDSDIKATIECKDILNSKGEYQCLFTCPPYSDKEQWLDVKPDKRNCDDWIDECLNRFKCKRYLFIIDNTKQRLSTIFR